MATIGLDNESVQLEFTDADEETHGPARASGFSCAGRMEKVQMLATRYVDVLGRHFGDGVLDGFMQELGLSVPAVVDDEDTIGLEHSAAGVELTLTREDALDEPEPGRYPEGAHVLSNIRFYGGGENGWSAFAGELPFGLVFGMRRDAAAACFPTSPDAFLNGRKLRWRLEACTVFAKFKDDRMIECAVQLPLPPSWT